MRILAVGAHPDDAEIGCGGTLAKYAAKGAKVGVLVLTNGEKGGDPARRRREALLASSRLGVKLTFFGNLQDTSVLNNHRTIRAIEKAVTKVDPDVVLTHNPYDVHQDHRNCALSTLSAAREVDNILFYESLALNWQFQPRIFVDIEESVKEKVSCLQSFKSQHHGRHFSTDAALGLSKFRGNQVGLLWAEAFDIYRMVSRQTWGVI